MSSGTPRPCPSQQSPTLTFTSRWIPDQTTTNITTPTSDSIRISVNSPDTIYSYPGRKGTSPMVILRPDTEQQQQCISGRIKLTITDSKPGKSTVGGILLMDSGYNPIFECGIGKRFNSSPSYTFTLRDPSYESGSPISVNVLNPDYRTQVQERTTVFGTYVNEELTASSEYIPEEIDPPSQYTYFQFIMNRSIGSLQFYDGIKVHSVSTDFTVDYIAIFLRGEGESILDLDSLVYSGFQDAPLPAVSQLVEADYTIIKDIAIDSPNSELFSGTSSLEACSNLCEMNQLQCTAFEFDNSLNMCTLRTYLDFENLYNKKDVISSGVPAETVTSNVYIKGSNLPTISYYYMFQDQNRVYTSISLSPDLTIVNLCIDNTYSNDFLAMDADKIRVHSGRFEYDYVPNSDNTKGTLALKFITSNDIIFYVVSSNNSYFREIRFLDSTRTTIIEPTKKAVAFDLNLRDDFGIGTTASTFDCVSVAPASSTAQFVRSTSNSVTFDATGLITEYKSEGTRIPLGTRPIISATKVILKKHPLTALMICSDKLLYLLNDDSIFTDLGAGFLFSNSPNFPTSLSSAYDITYSTPLIPSYRFPFSQSFPSKFLNGDEYTFFCTSVDTTYILRFVSGFVDYSAFGYTFRYVTRIVRNSANSIRGVIFTDKTGVTHFIYIDAVTLNMYDKISDEIEIGPFSKTFPMHNIGDIFLHSPASGNIYRFLCATYDTIWIHKHTNPTNRDIFYLESVTNATPGTKIGEIKIKTPTSFSDTAVEFMTSTNFSCTTTTTGSVVYIGDILNQSLQGFSVSEGGSVTDINSTRRLVFNTPGYNKFFIDDDEVLTYIIEFSSTTSDVLFYSVPISYDDFLNDVNLQVIASGVYITELSMENFYDTTITVTMNDGQTATFVYSNDRPELLVRTSPTTEVTLKRTLYTLNPLIPNIKRIGKVTVLGFTSDSIELRVDGSTLQNGDLIDFVVVYFGGTSVPLTLDNPPTTWDSSVGGMYTLNMTTTPMLNPGVYLVRILSRGTFVIDSTGGYFEIIDDTPVANPNMTVDTVSDIASSYTVSPPQSPSASSLVGTFAGNGTNQAVYIQQRRSDVTLKAPVGLDIYGGKLILSEYAHIIKSIWIENPDTGFYNDVEHVAGIIDNPGNTDGEPYEAQFNQPSFISVDKATGDIYVADQQNNSIRKISNGVISTVGVTGLNRPFGVFFANSKLYIADTLNHRIALFDLTTNTLTNIAGGGGSGLIDGPATSAKFSSPHGIYFNQTTNKLYITDTINDRIRSINLSTNPQTVSTVAGGTGSTGDAVFNKPTGITGDDSNNVLYVSDTLNHRIKRINLSTTPPTVTTIAGSGTQGFSDGPALNASLNTPAQLVYSNNTLYFTENNNNRIRYLNI